MPRIFLLTRAAQFDNVHVLEDTEMKRTKYEVEIGKEWCKCTRATETGTGWLHYELSDGTIGLKRPGTWRVKA